MSDFQVPTHEITTPIGEHKVVLKDYISGYDDEAIEAIYTRGKHTLKAKDPNDPTAGASEEMAIDGASIQDAEREGVKRVVLSVDGSDGIANKDGIIGLVYSMHKKDAAYVKKEVDKVINPPEDQPGPKGSGSKTTPTS